MEHLPGTTLDGAAHQQHVPTGVDAGPGVEARLAALERATEDPKRSK
jgi:hypothetical protein